MLEQLELVTTGLNIMQSDSSHLGDAMNTWLMLSSSPVLTDELKTVIKARMEQAITPAHILAYMVMNKSNGDLTMDHKQAAMDYVEQIDPQLQAVLAAFEIQDDTVFPPVAFKSVKDVLAPIKYWEFVATRTELEPVKKFCDLAIRVLTCPPSSAGNG